MRCPRLHGARTIEVSLQPTGDPAVFRERRGGLAGTVVPELVEEILAEQNAEWPGS